MTKVLDKRADSVCVFEFSSEKSPVFPKKDRDRLFLGISFERRIWGIPPFKGGGSKVELAELFETGDFLLKSGQVLPKKN